MDNAMATSHDFADTASCVDIREFRRLKYFFGQMLEARDFQAEQDFFRDKHKLHNRCLHGYGVICGLLVEPVPFPKECTSKEEQEEEALWRELEALTAQKASAPASPAGAAAPAQEAAPASGATGAAPLRRQAQRAPPPPALNLALRRTPAPIATHGSKRCAAGCAISTRSIVARSLGLASRSIAGSRSIARAMSSSCAVLCPSISCNG